MINRFVEWGIIMKIAVSGKGGVGKTTISANLAKLFRNKGHNVYAIDADPDSSLGLALGIEETALNEIKPIVDMKPVLDEKMGTGAYYTLNPEVSDIIANYCKDINGIKFFRMGGVKGGNSSCYCRENTFLKAIISSVMFDIKDVVIMDMAAGIEHLTRGTSGIVDLMLIVVEAGKSSIQTARVVQKLCEDLSIKNVKFIANKVKTNKEEDFIKQNFGDNELAGIIHHDEIITERSMGYSKYTDDIDNSELKEVLGKVIKL
jgi:CO dehydrogenase maturation factor